MNKKTFTNKQKKAFSLIELSIVLIIIGLLVAGVTGGSALITNSTIRAVTTEVRGYRVAVNSFYDKYQAFPGDYNNELVTGNGKGDNNAKIEFASATPGGPLLESNVAWNQLLASNILTTGVSSTSSISGTTAVSLTAVADQKGAPGIAYSKYKNVNNVNGYAFDFNNGLNQNCLILTGKVVTPALAAGTGSTLFGGAANSATLTGNIKAADALSIDAKMDDNNGTSGSVRNASSTGGAAYSGDSISLSFSIDIGSS